MVTATTIPATVLVVGVSSYFDSKLEDRIEQTTATAATIAGELFRTFRTIRTIRTIHALGAMDKLLAKYKTHLDHARLLGKKRAPIYGF